MNYNEWCEYSQFGQACQYDNQTLQFVENYNNAKHQQFLDQQENDRANKQIQRSNNFRQEGRDILPTDCSEQAVTNKIYQRPTFQEIYLASLPWS
jgi:hypothetical protein